MAWRLILPVRCVRSSSRLSTPSKTIINSNKKGDETFLERFISSDKIETIQDFTASKDALMDGLDTLYIEGGQTAVIDGVYLAAEHVADYKKGGDDDRRRRALIVVTDGEDRASYYHRDATLPGICAKKTCRFL